MDEHLNVRRKCAGSYSRWIPGFEHLLDLPQHYELDDSDIYSLLVEDSSSIRNLPNLPSNSRVSLEFCDL